MKLFLKLVTVSSFLSSALFAQLGVSGQATAEFFKSEDGLSQYVIDSGQPTFAWRWDLFADALITDHIALLSNIRMLQDQIPHVDLLAIRISDIASTGLSIQAGQIDLPFGNLGDRRFPKQNPFFDLPLMNEHITSLCESNYNLWTFSPNYAMRGDGVRILDQGLYDLGVKVYGSIGIVDYSVAVINGMVSATGTYSPGGLNSNNGLGTVARVAVTPFIGMTVGLSYALGPFMKNVSDSVLSQLYDKSPDNYWQHIVGGDLEFSFGHCSIHGEVMYNTWQYVQNVKLQAVGYSGSVEYAFTPRLSGAIRLGGLTFNDIAVREYVPEDDYGYTGPIGFVQYQGKWDHDVVRLEGASSYKIDQALLFKVGYQINRTYNLPKDPYDNVLFVQTVLSF
jgi:hypothetical protein